MPEQASKRGDTITTSRITGPFENHLVRFGVKGLNLKDSLDALEGWARHTNLDHDNMGETTVRPGQTVLATAGTVHHAVRKLNDEAAGTYTRLWGVDTNLYIGASGALAAIDGGYSGDPLTLLPHRPTLSGDPWMFVADSDRMRKVRADGLDLPIGLPAPAAAAVVGLGAEQQTMIADCDPGDATDAANWVPVAGLKDDGTATGDPDVQDDASPAGPGIALYTHPIATGGTATARLRSLPAPSRYDSWAGIAIGRDLNIVGGVAASDDDVIHLWMKTSHPQLIKEIRIYIVVSSTFDATILPGTPSDVVGNEDAYVKGFRQNDFTQFIQASQTQIDAAETARVYALRDQDLDDRAQRGRREGPAKAAEEVTDPSRSKTKQIGAGVHQWFELGSLGLSLRRGDFQRIGNTAGRDWSTVTGLILYVAADLGDPITGVEVGLEGVYLTGGRGPDTMEPGAQPYDFRYTNYDPRTGAESNGSPELADPTVNGIDSLRREIEVTPAAYGDAAVRQRFYRRGGSIVDDWYYEGENGADGGVFSVVETDDAISAASTLPIDHFEPVPTIDSAGNTVLAQPIPTLWGPLEGMLFGCGDPYRPGHLYYCLPDAPDHWSASGNVEVCPPSEVLMNGGLAGAQAFVFSKARLYAVYPNLTGVSGSVTAPPTLCKRGLLGRWAMAVGPGGIYFVAEDGVFVTSGGPEDWISREIDPLFQGLTKNGYHPIDKTATTKLRLTIWENKLYFSYQDTLGAPQVLVYAILNKFWRHYTFGRAQCSLQGEDEDDLLIGSLNLGKTYTLGGAMDAGLPIAWAIRTGAISGGTREEKLFGDAFLDVDTASDPITVQSFLNEETVTNFPQTTSMTAGRKRSVLDAFGVGPQKGHSLSMEVRGAASQITHPTLYQAGVAITMQPDVTWGRVTNWDDLGASDEFWITGITFDVDTGGQTKTVYIERDYAGVRSTVATLAVMSSGRHKVSFSWAGVPARQIRIRPDNDICEFWLLYRVDWIWVNEPPRISAWDIHFENAWDQYYTGLDLYCDTGGLEKHIEVYVDGVRLTNTLGGGLTYWPVTANGRRVVHLTLPWGRGHVFRFVAIDTNVGILYQHRWQLQEEPAEQANWNQNFTIVETQRDKWLNGVLIECDTFNVVKNVQVEVDGAVIATLAVQANGRSSLHFSFARVRGRVLRLFPIDGNPGRLYSHAWLFEQQPEAISKWEPIEEDLGDSYYTGLDLEADTQGVAKTVEVFVDGVSLGTFPVTTTVRQVVHLTFGPARGHVYRFRATDANVGYLYSHKWLAVPEPGEQTNWNQNFTVEEQLRDKWLKGILIECDTFGLAKTVRVEADGALVTILTVTATGRTSLAFSWARLRARVLRLLPTDANPGRIYATTWLFDTEPEEIARWDSNEQLLGDSYYTGLDLEVDTRNLVKQVEVYIDQALIGAYPVQANGRRVVHLSFGPGRGHVYRYRATDANPGYLYSHHWQTDQEPSEQTNWNQNFSILGSRADKWLKAVIFECDTFGANKNVQIEVDGATVEILTVNANGRQVIQRALTVQQLGRVWRMLPVDGNPGRLYTAQPIFDEEPFCLDRWETQETTHGVPGWFAPLYGHIVLKSTLPVVLTLIVQHNQPRTGSTAHRTTTSYTIPATGGVKSSHFQSFEAGKGVLIRYILTSAAPFWLYKAETVVVIQPWGGQQQILVKPFGDDDLDSTRSMTNASSAAEQGGGGLSAILGRLSGAGG